MKKKEKNTEKITWISGGQLRKRSLIITLCFTLLLSMLAVRVGYIQFVKGAEYQKLATNQQTKTRVITAKRGTIYDRNGNTLAISATVYRVSINPRDIKKDENHQDNIAEHQKHVAEKLSEILDVNYAEVYEKVMKTNAYQEIKRKVEDEVITELRKWIDEEDIFGVYIDEDAKRYYPNNSLASHIIGFTGTDDQGLSGIEAIYDEHLTGEDGYILTEVDAARQSLPLAEEVRIEPKNGNNITLTIDETIQYLVEKSIEQSVKDYNVKNGAACIVMNPNTGEILAMASNPDFDLNEPFAFPTGVEVEGYDESTWTGRTQEEVNILNSTVWRNKALSDTYEPGSTFKPISSVAFLEEGLITKDTIVSDSNYTLMGSTIHCWKKATHGTEPFYKAVWNSCNPVFARLAVQLGVEKYYSYVRAFGFYDKTGIILSGEGTSIFHKEPTELDMAVAAFGQRFQVTPLQMATAYCAIANGGELLVPQIVKEVTDSEGNVIEKAEKEVVRQVASTETCKTILEIMRGVVAEGTGSNGYVKGLRVAGKTGTSETVTTDIDGRYIVSFCGIFPSDNPEVVILYILDHPVSNPNQTNLISGGAISAPEAAKLIDEIANYLKIERVYSDKDTSELKNTVMVPSSENKTVGQFKAELKKVGLNIKVVGDDNEDLYVKSQMPAEGYLIPEGSTVVVYTADDAQEEMVEVPDLKNLSVNEALNKLNSKNLCMKIYGSGKVMKQSPAAGELVPIGTVVTVDFRTLGFEGAE